MHLSAVQASEQGVTFSLNHFYKGHVEEEPNLPCLNTFLNTTDIAGLASIIKVTTGCISLSTSKEF